MAHAPDFFFMYIHIIAGQCRTYPWPAVPDWTVMPECRCRTEPADYLKKCRCRTYFSPAFRHLYMIFQYHIARITSSAAVYGRAGCTPFLNSGMSVCLASSHSGTKMNNNVDAGTSPVRNAPGPDWDTGCRNADAGGIDLDADAQLWYIYTGHIFALCIWPYQFAGYARTRMSNLMARFSPPPSLNYGTVQSKV